MKCHIIIAAVICLVTADMAASKTTCFSRQQHTGADTSIAGQWKLLPAPATDSASGNVPVLVVNAANASFTGNTGCNNFSGKLMLNGDKLSFTEQSVITQDTCLGYNEDAFMASLIKVNHYKIENGVLELMDDGRVLFKWVRKEQGNVAKKL